MNISGKKQDQKNEIAVLSSHRKCVTSHFTVAAYLKLLK
jgi:hypothetical protein